MRAPELRQEHDDSSGTRTSARAPRIGRFMETSPEIRFYHRLSVNLDCIRRSSCRGRHGLRPLPFIPRCRRPDLHRPFLHSQDRSPEQCRRSIKSPEPQLPAPLEEIFGDGSDTGIKIRYVVEPAPLGTGGAIKYAGDKLTESVVVFNGDVLTQIDLAAVIRLHRERKALATIVLSPVDNPAAFGLVETDPEGNIQRFLEKPTMDQSRRTDHPHLLSSPTPSPHPQRVPVVDRAQLFIARERRTSSSLHDYGYWIDSHAENSRRSTATQDGLYRRRRLIFLARIRF